MAAPAGDKETAAVAPLQEPAGGETPGPAEPERGAGEVGLDEVLAATSLARGGAGWGRLDRFLAERSASEALSIWLGILPDQSIRPTRSKVLERLSVDVARLDALLCEQVDAILSGHQPGNRKDSGRLAALSRHSIANFRLERRAFAMVLPQNLRRPICRFAIAVRPKQQRCIVLGISDPRSRS